MKPPLLEREERDAAAATRLTMWEDGHGRVHGRFTTDALHGAMLKKALLAFAAPRHRAASGPLGERRPSPGADGARTVRADRALPHQEAPQDRRAQRHRRRPPRPYDSLIGGLKAAQLDTGETISASLARRLACEAGIIPAVLDGPSRVLDLGRKKRFHTDAQRIVAIIEQGGCCVEGCDCPPGLAHMHHPIAWSQGGRTDRDGLLICPRHHARAHDPAFTMTRLPTGKYTFHRRT